jgi:hypothetical protein
MAKKREPPPKLFWLTYRRSDGSAAGVVVIESAGLLHARLKASLAGADRGLEFVSGHRLDPISAGAVVSIFMEFLLVWKGPARCRAGWIGPGRSSHGRDAS